MSEKITKSAVKAQVGLSEVELQKLAHDGDKTSLSEGGCCDDGCCCDGEECCDDGCCCEDSEKYD